MNKIFVSIASYCDQELKDTVFSILNKAKSPDRIFLCILSQEKDSHQKIDLIINSFGVRDFLFLKMSSKDAKGVGFARSKIQESLNANYRYYLQIDSHTQFVEHWDEKIVADYEKCVTYCWGNSMIFSSYPAAYEYGETGNIKVDDSAIPTSLKIQKAEDGSPTFYEPKYKVHNGSQFGDYHAYFCGGMAFGYTDLFLKVPYDSQLYFNGEEQTMSVRFFCEGIRVVAPPNNYCFHHYTGKKRIRHWENSSTSGKYDKLGKERLLKFFNNSLSDGFGIKDYGKYQAWKELFVVEKTDSLQIDN